MVTLPPVQIEPILPEPGFRQHGWRQHRGAAGRNGIGADGGKSVETRTPPYSTRLSCAVCCMPDEPGSLDSVVRTV